MDSLRAMRNDPVTVQHQKSRIILQYIREKRKEGAKLRAIWLNSKFGDGRPSPAWIIHQLDRLEKNGELNEVREEKSQGYLRRFYDLNYQP